MKITVLGGCGAWPAAGQACSGYLVEHEGFRLVLDPGYATATFPDHVLPAQDAPYLSTARQAGEYAAKADAKRLVLTHLWPGTDPSAAHAAARRVYSADLDIATPGMTIDLG